MEPCSACHSKPSEFEGWGRRWCLDCLVAYCEKETREATKSPAVKQVEKTERADDGVDLMWLIINTGIPDGDTKIKGELRMDPNAAKGVWVEDVHGEHHVSIVVEGCGSTLQSTHETNEAAMAEAKRLRRMIAEARQHNARRWWVM